MTSFKDLDGFIWYNGLWMEWREAKVHLINHGLHYASSVFEGERAYDGHVFKAQQHHDRLVYSAKTLEMNLEVTADDLNGIVHDLLKKQNLTNAYIRPVAWMGSGTMGVSSINARPHVAVAAWEWPSYYSADMLEKGIHMVSAPWRRPPPECAPVQAKAAGLYMIATLSKNHAERAGAQDALMLDHEGNVAEATSANIFMIKDKVVITPIADRFLNGITRQTVLQLAKDKGYETMEKRIRPEELMQADEIFLTGTAAEITPVGKINEHKFEVGAVIKDLRSAYSDLVHSKKN